MSNIADEINRIRATKPKFKSEYKCDKCKDVKVIMVKDSQTGRMVARDCDCAAKANAIRYMRMSGISEVDLKKTIADYKTFDESELTQAKKIAYAYQSRFRGIRLDRHNSLLLSGKPGTGKTMLGIAILNHILNDGIPAIYVSYIDIITKLKQMQYGTDEDKQRFNQELDRLQSIDVLFIDDLFKASETQKDRELLYNIINFRYLKAKPIIISTEKTPDELIKVDEALGSRIIEMCKGYTVIFKDTQNYRLR